MGGRIQSSPDALVRLVGELADGLKAQGFSLERRPFHAHVTLARRCRIRAADPMREGEPLPAPIVWNVARMTLTASEPASGPPRYRELDGWPLAADDQPSRARRAAIARHVFSALDRCRARRAATRVRCGRHRGKAGAAVRPGGRHARDVRGDRAPSSPRCSSQDRTPSPSRARNRGNRSRIRSRSDRLRRGGVLAGGGAWTYWGAWMYWITGGGIIR